MGKVEIKANAYIYPMPAVIIGANVNNKANFLTVAYCAAVEVEPPMIAISLGKNHYSNEGIKKNGTFSVNIPSANMVEVTDIKSYDMEKVKKLYTETNNYDHLFIDNKEKSRKLLFSLYNFNKIPPIIGVLIADQYGNTLMVIEYDSKNKNNFGPIKSYISENEKTFLEIDLISMYFSSLRSFAGQTNIQNISNLEIHGSNIKVQIFFLFDKFMIILFLNSKAELNLKEKTLIVKHFEEKLTKYEFEFKHFNAAKSRKILGMLEIKGKAWLKQLNRNYLQSFKDTYLKKHEIIDELTREIEPIIKEVLLEYLEYIHEDIVKNISKEIKTKIQDSLFGFDANFNY